MKPTKPTRSKKEKSDAPERKTRPMQKQARKFESAGRQDMEGTRDPRERIARRAYELYEAGGYQQGKEVEHWLEAERQLEAEARARNS